MIFVYDSHKRSVSCIQTFISEISWHRYKCYIAKVANQLKTGRQYMNRTGLKLDIKQTAIITLLRAYFIPLSCIYSGHF